MNYDRLFKKAKEGANALLSYSDEQINETLLAVADAAIDNSDYILQENKKDLFRMNPDNPMYDRLKLTEERIESIAKDIRNVASLPSPLGRVLKSTRLPNGLEIEKVSVPFGVIGVIYEARPNVGFDVFSLCFKAGSASVLKGGSDADFSNKAIINVLQSTLNSCGISTDCVILLPSGHDSAAALLDARKYVDLIIPRGSSNLINFVRENARVPVIETGAGVCHAYFHKSGDLQKGAAIINNAKTRRVSVCNALDCLIIDSEALDKLPQLCAKLQESNVEIYADPQAYAALKGNYPENLLFKSRLGDFGQEFLGYKMAVKSVGSIEEAVAHISRYGSGHSESIIAEDEKACEFFFRMVDAACLYSNAPTSFTDGAQFGLGAEIGISTQKLHARGPMALEEITTYKWLIRGNGQIRE